MSNYVAIVGRYKCRICGKLFERGFGKCHNYDIKQDGNIENWLNKGELWSSYPPFVHKCGSQYGLCELIGFAEIV